MPGVAGKFRAAGFPEVSRYTELFKARRDYASRFEIIPAAHRSKIDRRTSEIQIRFPRRRRDASTFPRYLARVRSRASGLARENSNVTLKVMTREYYRRGMSPRERPPYVCTRAANEKLPVRVCNGARTVHRNVLVYSCPA